MKRNIEGLFEVSLQFQLVEQIVKVLNSRRIRQKATAKERIQTRSRSEEINRNRERSRLGRCR